MMRLGLAAIALMILAGVAFGQHQHGQTPYAGLQQRVVKGLSEQQITDLRTGRGMSLALPAELNGYPGPIHALELADQLQLTDQQRQRLGELYDAMRAETVPVGERLIEQEMALDQAFAGRRRRRWPC